MTQKDAELLGRLIVGMMTMALYVQATKASPTISISMLQQLGMDCNKDQALSVLSPSLFLEAIHDTVALPLVLMAEWAQKKLDDLPPSRKINQQQIFDRDADLLANKRNRIFCAMGSYGLITGVAAYVLEHKDMPPSKAVIVGAMTALVCYGVKNLLIDTVASQVRQLIDDKAAILAR